MPPVPVQDVVRIFVIYDVLPEVAAELQRQVAALPRELAEFAHTYVDPITPVDTGLMRETANVSAGASIGENGATLAWPAVGKAGQPYPVYVNYGAQGRVAQPFATMAYEAATLEAQRRLEELATLGTH